MTVDVHLESFNRDILLLCIFARIPSKNALSLAPGQDRSVDEDDKKGDGRCD